MRLEDSLRKLVAIDECLANKTRLAIMVYLAVNGKTKFKQLQNLLNLTPGNLASHLSRLEQEGYIKIGRDLFDARTRTIVPTPLGLSALTDIILKLREVVKGDF